MSAVFSERQFKVLVEYIDTVAASKQPLGTIVLRPGGIPDAHDLSRVREELHYELVKRGTLPTYD